MEEDFYDDEYADSDSEIRELKGVQKEITLEDKIVKDANKLSRIDTKAHKSRIELDYQAKRLNSRNKSLKILLLQTIDKYRKNPNKFIQHPNQIKNLPPNWMEDAFAAFPETELSTNDKNNIRKFFESLDQYKALKAPRDDDEEEDYKRQVGYTTTEDLAEKPPFDKFDEMTKMDIDYDDTERYPDEDEELEEEIERNTQYIEQAQQPTQYVQPQQFTQPVQTMQTMQNIQPMQVVQPLPTFQQPQMVGQPQMIQLKEKPRGYNFNLSNITPAAQKFIKLRKVGGNEQVQEQPTQNTESKIIGANSVSKYLFRPKNANMSVGATTQRKSKKSNNGMKIKNNISIKTGIGNRKGHGVEFPKINTKINLKINVGGKSKQHGSKMNGTKINLPKINNSTFKQITRGNIGDFKLHNIGAKESNMIKNANQKMKDGDGFNSLNLKKILNKENLRIKAPTVARANFDFSIGRMTKRKQKDGKSFIDDESYESY